AQRRRRRGGERGGRGARRGELGCDRSRRRGDRGARPADGRRDRGRECRGGGARRPRAALAGAHLPCGKMACIFWATRTLPVTLSWPFMKAMAPLSSPLAILT